MKKKACDTLIIPLDDNLNLECSNVQIFLSSNIPHSINSDILFRAPDYKVQVVQVVHPEDIFIVYHPTRASLNQVGDIHDLLLVFIVTH